VTAPEPDAFRRAVAAPSISRYLRESVRLPTRGHGVRVSEGLATRHCEQPGHKLPCVCNFAGRSRAWSQQGEGVKSRLPRSGCGQKAPSVYPDVFMAVVSSVGMVLYITQIGNDCLHRAVSQWSTALAPCIARENVALVLSVCFSAAGGECSHVSELIGAMCHLPEWA